MAPLYGKETRIEKGRVFCGTQKAQGPGMGTPTSAHECSLQPPKLRGADLEGRVRLGPSGPAGSRLPAESRLWRGAGPGWRGKEGEWEPHL